MRRGSRTIVSRLMQSRIVLIALVIITVISGTRLFIELSRRNAVLKQIATLNNELSSVQSETADLTSMVQYMKTDAYIEMEARRKFGLKKPDETVIVIPNATSTGRELTQSTIGPSRMMATAWFDYFFGSHE